MSRAPTGGDSDSDDEGGLDKEYQVELLYHAADGAVVAERLGLTSGSTWQDVRRYAQQRSGHADFQLEDEDGGKLGAQTPLAWIKADQQGRPYRRAVVKRQDAADGVFERRDVVAPAHVGLVANTINAGMDTTTLLSESIENSVQHGATLVKVFVDPARRRIVVFDNGRGIRPEHVDVLAKAGASTVRDDEIQAPVRGVLLAHGAGGKGGARSQGSRASARSQREFGLLRAEWGRYGVGRYAQLNGTETKVRFVSVAKGVKKVVVFEQDMAKMAHQKEIIYDYNVYDHGTKKCALALHEVNKLVRDDAQGEAPRDDDPDVLDKRLRFEGVGTQHFTCLTIDKVDAGFFDDWAENRQENLSLLAEKYVLHLGGNAGEASRSWLRSCGVLPAQDADAKIVTLKIDGVDLGESGEMSEHDVDVANRFADLARLADLREEFERKRHVDKWVLHEEGASTARAELAALSVYFPQENGMDTMPESVRDHRTLVLWNGLFLRDETIAAWPYAAPRNHRGQVAPGDAKLDKRCVTVLYLESTRLFAPEIHKRHLRPHDAAYKRLADEPPTNDEFTRDLQRGHRERLRAWNEAFDEEERYPLAAGEMYCVSYGAAGLRRIGTSLSFRSDRYQIGDVVRFALSEEKKKEDQNFGAGRIVAFICDAEQTNTTGFFICASVLAPRDDAAGLDFVQGFNQRGADLVALEEAGPGRWNRDLYVTCPSGRLRGAKCVGDDAKAAVDAAKKHFPAQVQLVECGATKLKKEEMKLSAEPFGNFENTLYTSTPAPEFAFNLLTFNAKTKALDAAACAGIELELVARTPGAEDWSDAVVVAAGGCDASGVFRLAKPEPLNEMGVWQFRARLRETPNAVWTALAKWERTPKEERPRLKACDKPRVKLDTLARRDDAAFDGLQGSEPPFSRAAACKLNPSEPVQLTCSMPRAAKAGVLLDAAVADLSVTFQDAFAEKAADGQQRVKPKDYDVTGEHSRAWIEVEGREPFYLDLSACRLARSKGEGALTLDNLIVPAEAVPNDVLLPVAAELHLELHPVLKGEYEYVTYAANAVAGRTQSSPRRVFRALDKTFQSLIELEQHVNKVGNKWLVPRTVAPLALTLTSAPAKLTLRDERALVDLERPFIATCTFALEAASGHALDIRGMGLGSDLVGDSDLMGMDIVAKIEDIRKAQGNDDGSVTQEYQIDAPLGWSGKVRFDVDGGPELTVDASTTDRKCRVAVLTQTGDAVDEEVDAASPRWIVCDEDSRKRISLGAMDLAEVGATHLRVEVVDATGAVDAKACGAQCAWLYLRDPEGGRVKTKVMAPLVDGVAVIELTKLASSTSSRIKEQRESGKFSFHIMFVDADAKPALTSQLILLALKAGAPDSIDIDEEAFQALLDSGDDRGVLTLGKPAPYVCLIVRDEAGTQLESEQLAGLQATLTCVDACHTLRDAPTAAPIDGSAGAMTDDNIEPGSLPGGWSVLSGWDAPPDVAEGARGWPITFRLAVTGGDVQLQTEFKLHFRNGPLAEVQAVALPGNGLEVEQGELFQGDDFFSLKDASGNPFWSDPTAEADAPPRPMFDLAIECDAAGVDLRLERVGTKKKSKKKKAPVADEPQPEADGAIVLPPGDELQSLTVPECRVVVASGVLETAVAARLVLRVRSGCPTAAAALQLDFLTITVAPSSKYKRLEIFRRDKGQIGVAGGEIPLVGADPTALGLDLLSDNDRLEVPTGKSVLDVLQLSGMCEDGKLATRDEDRRDNFRGDLRWHQGEKDPGAKGWKKIDALEKVDPSWFAKLGPDEERPIRFAIYDRDAKGVEVFTTLLLKRVAGAAQRIDFTEAATSDTDDGERQASARYEARVYDSPTGSKVYAHPCACAARLMTSTTNDADDDLAALCNLEVRRWVKGRDPADAVVDVLSLDANDVQVDITETDATFIEIKLVDATNNTRPIEDLQVTVAMKVYPKDGEDDVDGQLNVSRTVELRLENALGRAAREAKTEGEREAQAEYAQARAAVEAQQRAVAGLEDEQRDKERQDRLVSSKEDARRALEAARQATADAETALKAAEDADEAPLAREHMFHSDPKIHKRFKDFRAELVRKLHKAGLAPTELRGFASELATVEDDSDAACCAYIVGKNTLYLASGAAREIAQEVAKKQKISTIAVVDLSLAGAAEGWNDERHAPVEASDAGFGAVAAVLRLTAQRCDLEQVFRTKIGKALIFPDDERLRAADDARGRAEFKRVSRESPSVVLKAGGACTIGTSTEKPPPFVFASPGDDQAAAAEKRLRDAKAAEARAEADVENYADVAEPAATDVDARLAAAKAELLRLKDEKRAKKAACAPKRRPEPEAPLDDAEEEAPRSSRKRKADVGGLASLAKQKKKKPAARKKKPTSKRPREACDENNWDFDGGVDDV